MLDWWPEAWTHPVGYHVTLPCTGAAHRTFDAAWLAVDVGTQVQMYYAPDALRDRNRSTSAFGASGLCRTHSMGMPMDVLNPIRLCTQADNQPADPMVPMPSRGWGTPQWAPEQCSTSPFDVPWDATANPLAPTSIGTLPPAGALMALLRFNGWDVDGPQPLRQCASGADCCPSCSCLLTPSGGVCAVLQKGVFECLTHAHCPSSLMCAGDGKCTRGILEVTNNYTASPSIAFRTFSSNCSSSTSDYYGLNAVDTWGLSKEEIIPDILNASGMCSYRSWYEHRRLQQSGACSSSGAGVCTLKATDSWNFTAPDRKPAPVFDSGVLRTLPHACDVDYEHLAGLKSCSPLPTANGTYLLVDAYGTPSATLIAQVNRTRTYRLSATSSAYSAAQLPIVRHTDAAANPGAGFLGVNLNYTALGYDTYITSATNPSARPRLCSSLALCSTQSAWKMWFVNGIQEPTRFVGQSTQRTYSVTDMIACGSMGFLLDGSSSTCQIDPGVAPLFFAKCALSPTYALCSTYANGGRYAAYKSATQLAAVAADLNGLLTSMRQTAGDWVSYLVSVSAAESLYNGMQAQRSTSIYWYSTGSPTGLYYLAEYAAYEMPYAWWFRCSWLMGVTPGPVLTPCGAWDTAFASSSNNNPATGSDGSAIFNASNNNNGNPSSSSSSSSLSLLAWLAGLGTGVFTQTTVSAARDFAHSAIANLLSKQNSLPPPAAFNFGCHASAKLREELLVNNAYIQTVISQAGRPWTTAVPPLCDGFTTCLDHGPVTLVDNLNLVRQLYALISPTGTCSSSCTCTSGLSGNQVCSYMLDMVPSQVSLSATWLQLFAVDPALLSKLQTLNRFASLTSLFDPLPNGCNTYPNSDCRDPTQCRCLYTTAQAQELSLIGLSAAQPNTPPLVKFGTKYALDVCNPSSSASGLRCDLASSALTDACSAQTTQARTVMSLYCDAYANGGAALFNNLNPSNDQCLMSGCLPDNADISLTQINIPPGINVDVITAAPIPCYALICPGDDTNDGRVVLDPTPYTQSVFTEYRLFVYQVQYIAPDTTYRRRSRRAQLLDGVSNSPIANYKFGFCADIVPGEPMYVTLDAIRNLSLSVNKVPPLYPCKSNRQRTRSLGADYSAAYRLPGTNYMSTAQTPATYDQIAIDMVDTVETSIDTASQYSNAGLICSKAVPTDLSSCNFTTVLPNGAPPTSPRVSNSLAVALECSDDLALTACRDVGASICSELSNVHTYDKQKCDTARGACLLTLLLGPLGVLAASACEVGVNSQPECYQGQTPWEQCMSPFNDLGTCRTKYSLKCTTYVYQRNINQSPCGSTTLQCPYGKKQTGQRTTWEQQYRDAGLPISGFCPDCSSGFSCPATKSSMTYRAAQAATNLHTLVSTPASNGDTLSANAHHARIRLGSLGVPGGAQHPVQCSSADSITCPSPILRSVEYRSNLHVCVPCLAAPSTQCSGKHLCGFYTASTTDAKSATGNNNVNTTFPDYTTAFQAALNTAQATLNGLTAGLLPLWRPWLQTNLFQSYNPSVLIQGFNAAILQLNGQCTLSGSLPDPSQCQNDAPRRTLRAHVQSQYKVGEGVIVPSLSTLTYYVPASLLLGSNLPTWEAGSRGAASFMQALLDDSICSQFTYESLVCLQQPATATSNSISTILMNPLISGDFELSVGCDTTLMDGTTRAISSSCNQLACPGFSSSSDTYNAYVPGGDGPTAWTACKLKDHQVASQYTVQRSAPTNLCGKQPATPLRCATPQGAIAGWRRAGVPVPSLYAYGSGTPAPSTVLGMAAGTSGANVGAGPWDIGGHYVRLKLSADGALSISALPLRSSSSLAAARTMNATLGWPTQWAKQAQQNVPVPICKSWACPFRRRHYWNGGKGVASSSSSQYFGPTIPDASRTAATYGTTSHPSMPYPSSASAVLSSLLGEYRTTNGFCACPAGATQLCTSAYTAATFQILNTAAYYSSPLNANASWLITPNAPTCSQAELVNALIDMQPRVASVMGNNSTACTYQLDWPWPGGPLRDGAWLPNSLPNPLACATLDRLSAFRYRFNNTMQKLPSANGATTYDDGGDCHMGRAAHTPTPGSTNTSSMLSRFASCVVIAKTATYLQLSCPDGSTPLLPRPTQASVLNSVSTKATPSVRTPCDRCSPLPQFFAGTSNQSLPLPETSYGRPWRWSASRLLARDLRFKLCGNATSCDAVKRQAWTTGNFWTKMATGTLLGPTPAPDSFNTRFLVQRQRQAARLAAANAAWDQPWLLCTSNSSSPTKQTCSGVLGRETWLSGDRTNQCRAVLSQPNSQAAAVDLSLCDLDSSLNSLCSIIQQARYDVFEANCQLTGQCRTTSFFYQPATFALDDGAFVRSVVGTFYNFTSPGSCPVMDEETQAILASNRQTAQNCPAQDLEALLFAIQAAREALHSFVVVGYYFGMIAIDLISLVTGANAAAVVTSILAYFNRIASEFQQFFASFGDLLYKMVMETGKLGKALQTIITAICSFMSDLFFPIIRPFLCLIQSVSIVVLDTLSSIIGAVSYLVGGSLSGFSTQLSSASDSIGKADLCHIDNPFHCQSMFPPDTNMPASLPMPTRCWVGYIQAAGDRPQDGLGCSASDTCMDDDGSTKACAQCAVGFSGASYACDSLTKLCRLEMQKTQIEQSSDHSFNNKLVEW